MKANPLFKRTKPSPPLTGNNKSTGVEILTDDEVGTVSSEDPHGHMSLFLHHQHEQQAQHFQQHRTSANAAQAPTAAAPPPPVAAKFDLKGPVYGYRSLSS